MNGIMLSIPDEILIAEAKDFATKTIHNPQVHLCLNNIGGLQSYARGYTGVVLATYNSKSGLRFVTSLLSQEQQQVIRDAVQNV